MWITGLLGFSHILSAWLRENVSPYLIFWDHFIYYYYHFSACYKQYLDEM